MVLLFFFLPQDGLGSQFLNHRKVRVQLSQAWPRVTSEQIDLAPEPKPPPPPVERERRLNRVNRSHCPAPSRENAGPDFPSPPRAALTSLLQPDAALVDELLRTDWCDAAKKTKTPRPRMPRSAGPQYNLLYESYIELFFLYIFIFWPEVSSGRDLCKCSWRRRVL